MSHWLSVFTKVSMVTGHIGCGVMPAYLSRGLQRDSCGNRRGPQLGKHAQNRAHLPMCVSSTTYKQWVCVRGMWGLQIALGTWLDFFFQHAAEPLTSGLHRIFNLMLAGIILPPSAPSSKTFAWSSNSTTQISGICLLDERRCVFKEPRESLVDLWEVLQNGWQRTFTDTKHPNQHTARTIITGESREVTVYQLNSEYNWLLKSYGSLPQTHS